MSRPLIGITTGPAEPESPFLQQRAAYARSVAVAGGLPVLIPGPLDAATLDELLPRLDGVLLPGGADVEPSLYGAAREARTETNPPLDELELHVARWLLARDRPILGICRGQQLLNVALGGTLVQHLDDHRQRGDRQALTHALTVAPDSRLAEILGTTQTAVNTMHHQAVRDVARGLTAVAWAADGTIEGLEGTTHPWLLMVQFHPEELVDVHAPSARLFEAFVAACAARMSAPTPALG
jgi:putative glutamine amidotransferase